MEQIIKKALKEGGKILMRNFGKLKSYQVKEDQSNIVTQADIDSEMAIVAIIKKKLPWA